MSSADVSATVATIQTRLDSCYANEQCDWSRFYKPRHERANFATRYHLVYPALAYYIRIRRDRSLAARLRPQLDTMFRGLLSQRTWNYWHSELGEPSWPLQERNLTFAGRLATFVGFYLDAYGEPPAGTIELEGRSTSYSQLSESLWRQMTSSPTGGVTCYRHESMTQCNAHLLINNILHDRLFHTRYSTANAGWLATLEGRLVTGKANGPLFFYGTESKSSEPATHRLSLGVDIWTLFLMSAVVPEQTARWFAEWKNNVIHARGRACVEIPSSESEGESSSTPLATAWAFCLAQELGHRQLAEELRLTLAQNVDSGFELDPLLSGLYLLGTSLEPGAFRRLVQESAPP